MDNGLRAGDVGTHTLDTLAVEIIGVISGIALASLEGEGIKVLRCGGSRFACPGLRELDDAVPAGRGLSGLARE